MEFDQFRTWLRQHKNSFPLVKKWLDGLPKSQRDPLVHGWFTALQSVSAQDATSATKQMLGDRKSFSLRVDEHAAVVKELALNIRQRRYQHSGVTNETQVQEERARRQYLEETYGPTLDAMSDQQVTEMIQFLDKPSYRWVWNNFGRKSLLLRQALLQHLGRSTAAPRSASRIDPFGDLPPRNQFTFAHDSNLFTGETDDEILEPDVVGNEA